MNSKQKANSIDGEDWAKGKTKVSDFMDLIDAIFEENPDLVRGKKGEYQKARNLAAQLILHKLKGE